MKKAFAMILVLCLMLSLLPAGVLAESGSGRVSGTGMVSQTVERLGYTSPVTGSPVLAEGVHEEWIDRIGNLPDFAREFYRWLEDNATLDGALVNPDLAQQMEGDAVYLVTSVDGTAQFTYQSNQSISDLAYEAAVADLGDLPYILADYAFATYAAFDRDHPEIFWLTGSCSCGVILNYDYTGGDGYGVTDYTMELYLFVQAEDYDLRDPLYQTVEAITAATAQREADIQRILEGFPYSASVLEQVTYFNEVLTTSNAYNSAVATGDMQGASTAAWECVSALAGSVGTDGPVCEGYARAFNVLCDRVGIPCVLVEGDGNGAPHMWNYVQIGESWYAVDVTFNDPADLNNLEAAVSGSETNNWIGLGVNSATELGKPFSWSHIVSNVSYQGGLDYSNGPELSENGLTAVDYYLDISSYRSAEGYTAPVREGYVFAGWFEDETLTVPLSKSVTTGSAYARFVSDQVLTLKIQTTNGTNAQSESTDLRLLTSVAGLDLNSVSFEVTAGTAVQTLSSRTVYEKIKAGDFVLDSPKPVFSPDSAYFVTYTILGVPQNMFDFAFTAVPCWETLDGTTVRGISRTFTVSETY